MHFWKSVKTCAQWNDWFKTNIVKLKPSKFKVGREPPISLTIQNTNIYHKMTLLCFKCISDWETSDVISLLRELITLSYTDSESVLPLVKSLVTEKSHHIQLITELPDRILITIFTYLNVDSLESCQQVCLTVLLFIRIIVKRRIQRLV